MRGIRVMLRRFPRIQVALLATGLLAALPSAAHHSFAIFDRDKQVTLSGTVKEFQWTNPHVFVQLVVKNAEGAVKKVWNRLLKWGTAAKIDPEDLKAMLWSPAQTEAA